MNWLLGIKKQKETVQLMKYGVVCLELSVVCIIKGYVVMACGSKELGGGGWVLSYCWEVKFHSLEV